MKITLRLPRRSAVLSFCILLALAMAIPAFAQNTGALYTTINDGSKVNYNIYDNKSDVYINGGPQNQNASGLPDGVYVFQVTQPPAGGHNEVLLSVDGITCREVLVSGGVVAGPVATGCEHKAGIFNSSNGSTPVQLCAPTGCPAGGADFLDTANAGGEYKVWLTPIGKYSPDTQNNCSAPNTNIVFGFCASDSKTDNFKVKKAPTPPCTTDCNTPLPATISVCKFNDWNRNGLEDGGEPLLDGWQIVATGVDADAGTGVTQTTVNGCTTFTYSGFVNPDDTETVTLTEVQQTGWTQSAPLSDPTDTSTVIVTQSVTLHPGDNAITPDFGNYLAGSNPTATKTASGTYNQPYTWTIKKLVDKTLVDQNGGTATFTYTVTVTKTAGTPNSYAVNGKITAANANTTVVNNQTVTDHVMLDAITDTLNDNSGTTCTVTIGSLTLSAASTDFPYTCSPVDGTATQNNASVSWSTQLLSSGASLIGGSTPASAAVTFSPVAIDDCVNVSDNYDSLSPRKICATTTYSYSHTFNVTNGQCTSYDNTATFVAVDTGATNYDTKTVKVCGTNTGGLTMGYWQNKNGQGQIAGVAKSGTCPLTTYLRNYVPFQDLSSTATCGSVVSTSTTFKSVNATTVTQYVASVIYFANASGASMNAMLKAQMLATALDAYFTTVGGQWIDLTKVCSISDGSSGGSCSGTNQNDSPAFGGTTCMKVADFTVLLNGMIGYAGDSVGNPAPNYAANATAGGGTWYAQNKTVQGMAKNAFDAVNNNKAFVCK